MERKLTRKIMVGGVPVGGGAPVSIQSMLNTRTTDVDGCLAQIRALAAAGCEIARLAVPDMEAAEAFGAICAASPLPLVADIHFDYRLAIRAAENGAAKIRINPGNIGGEERVRAVVDVCKEKKIPIRIGVNGGSLDKRLLEKYGHPTPEALVESAFSHIRMLEDVGFGDICVSMKSSNVPLMMQAYRLMHERSDYPLHVGVTETGTEYMGTIKSAMGIGGLLMEGIGDTLRVSLTDEPENEVYAGYDILRAAGYAVAGPEIISCPTCGRTQYPMIEIANEVEARLRDEGFKKPLKIAIMGCVVNGPGEAAAADIGIAIHSGAAIAREIADVTIRADSLEELVTLKAIANALQKRVGSNYRFVLSFNSALILLGALGILPPATSAMLHNLSTLGISLRSMTDLLEQKPLP